MKHRMWRFLHDGKFKNFGPYLTAEEAQAAFQFRYGYWQEVHSSRPWMQEGNDEATTQ